MANKEVKRMKLTVKEKAMLKDFLTQGYNWAGNDDDFLGYQNASNRSEGAVLGSLVRKGLITIVDNGGIYTPYGLEHIKQYNVFCGEGWTFETLEELTK